MTTYLLRHVGLKAAPPPLSDEEWENFMGELADIVLADVPLLSDYDVSREGIYEERDQQLMESIAVNPAQI